MNQPTPDPQEIVQAGRIRPDGAIAEDKLPEFVTRLTPVEQQVGINVIAALQHRETVAVLSTVAMGPDGGQSIVSIGLDPELLGQVRDLIRASKTEKTQRIPCIGFQCHIEDSEDD